MFAWWCLTLWPCLFRFFVMIVGVLWVFYIQWHQLPRWVLLLYLPSLLSFVFLPNPLEDVKKEVQGNTDNRNLQASAMVKQMREAEKKAFSFLLLPLFLLSSLINWRRYHGLYLVDSTFLYPLFSLLTLSLPPNQMVSPSRKENEDFNIPAQT